MQGLCIFIAKNYLRPETGTFKDVNCTELKI